MATKQRTRAKKSQSKLTLQKPNGQLGPGQQRWALGMQRMAKRTAIVRKTSIAIAVRSDLLARLVPHAANPPQDPAQKDQRDRHSIRLYTPSIAGTAAISGVAESSRNRGWHGDCTRVLATPVRLASFKENQDHVLHSNHHSARGDRLGDSRHRTTASHTTPTQ